MHGVCVLSGSNGGCDRWARENGGASGSSNRCVTNGKGAGLTSVGFVLAHNSSPEVPWFVKCEKKKHRVGVAGRVPSFALTNIMC